MALMTETAPDVKASRGYFGRAMKRVEDPRLIKGIATYVDDLKLPGVLYAEFVRSPHANAKINSIKTDGAKKLSGVVGIFTGADVNDKVGTIPCASPLPGGKSPDHTVLAGARAYFVGHRRWPWSIRRRRSKKALLLRIPSSGRTLPSRGTSWAATWTPPSKRPTRFSNSASSTHG